MAGGGCPFRCGHVVEHRDDLCRVAGEQFVQVVIGVPANSWRGIGEREPSLISGQQNIRSSGRRCSVFVVVVVRSQACGKEMLIPVAGYVPVRKRGADAITEVGSSARLKAFAFDEDSVGFIEEMVAPHEFNDAGFSQTQDKIGNGNRVERRSVGEDPVTLGYHLVWLVVSASVNEIVDRVRDLTAAERAALLERNDVLGTNATMTTPGKLAGGEVTQVDQAIDILARQP